MPTALRFFFDGFQRFNRQYAELLGLEDEAGTPEREKPRETGDHPESPAGGGSFSEKWSWVYCIDLVSERIRDTWKNTQDMNIVEFLNILSYIRDKNRYDREQIRKYKQS